jgi:hypothetical protein
MAQVAGLQRFLHVGTAMSCSPEPDSLVAESAEFRERAEHLVEYTHSKSTIEQLMQQTALRYRWSLPALYCGGPYSSRLSALQQYLLGVQHGADAAKIYVLDGRPNRCDPGGLLRRCAADAA